MSIDISIPSQQAMAFTWVIAIIIVIAGITVGIYFFEKAITNIKNTKRAHDPVFEFENIAPIVLGTIGVIGALSTVGFTICQSISVQSATDIVNNTVATQYPDISDISCPTLPDNPQEQNAKLENSHTRVDCSWKYNGKTVNGSLYFNINDSDGTVTFINDNNTKWCPVDWRIGDDCMPYTRQ